MIDIKSIFSLFQGTNGAEEEDCSTEEKDHTSPASSEPVDQSQVTTQEQRTDDSVIGQESAQPAEGLGRYGSVDVGEEPGVDEDSSSQSVDSLMADWQEDLEAFKQMEKDEL